MIYFYVLLLRIVAYLEGYQKILVFVFVLGFMVFSTFKRLPNNEALKITKNNLYAIALIAFVLFHGLIFGTVQIRDLAVLLTYWIWFIFTLTYFKNKSLDEALKFILISFLIFNVGNYIHFKMYFADQKAGFNSIMAIFGVVDYRIYFPLSSGANIFTSQLSLSALIALHFFKKTKKKLLYISVYVFYIYMLVLADSRQILLLTFVFSFVYWFSLKKLLSLLRQTWWIIGLLILFSLYIFYNTNVFDVFKRPGELAGNTLSRIEIWSIALKVIFQDYHLFTGYGLNGFENNLVGVPKDVFENQNLQTSHNFFLQNFIDFGIFGILIIIVFLMRLFKNVLSLKSSIMTILVVMILLMGITESIPTFYSFEPTLFFIALLTIISNHNERKDVRLS